MQSNVENARITRS